MRCTSLLVFFVAVTGCFFSSSGWAASSGGPLPGSDRVSPWCQVVASSFAPDVTGAMLALHDAVCTSTEKRASPDPDPDAVAAAVVGLKAALPVGRLVCRRALQGLFDVVESVIGDAELLPVEEGSLLTGPINQIFRLIVAEGLARKAGITTSLQFDTAARTLQKEALDLLVAMVVAEDREARDTAERLTAVNPAFGPAFGRAYAAYVEGPWGSRGGNGWSPWTGGDWPEWPPGNRVRCACWPELFFGEGGIGTGSTNVLNHWHMVAFSKNALALAKASLSGAAGASGRAAAAVGLAAKEFEGLGANALLLSKALLSADASRRTAEGGDLARRFSSVARRSCRISQAFAQIKDVFDCSVEELSRTGASLSRTGSSLSCAEAGSVHAAAGAACSRATAVPALAGAAAAARIVVDQALEAAAAAVDADDDVVEDFVFACDRACASVGGVHSAVAAAEAAAKNARTAVDASLTESMLPGRTKAEVARGILESIAGAGNKEAEARLEPGENWLNASFDFGDYPD
jgi:hypothetical protein